MSRVRVFVGAALVAGLAHAEPSGNYRQSALREDFTVTQWQDSCGPAPKSTQSGGGETIAVRLEENELVLVGGGRVFRSNECYDMLPGLGKDAHTKDAENKNWRTKCSSPKNDPRRAILQTQVSATEGRIDLSEVGTYEVTVSDGHCAAQVRRTRSYVRIESAAVPAPTLTAAPQATALEKPTDEPVPERPSASCSSPGAPARLEVKPARKLVRPGEAFHVRARVTDASGCVLATETTWNVDRARGLSVDSQGRVKVDADAPSGTTELMVSAKGKRAVVLIETTTNDKYDELLRHESLNADGESFAGTNVVLDAKDEREVQAIDSANARRTMFGVVIASLSLALLGLYVWVRKREQRRERRVREETEARYREDLQMARARQSAQDAAYEAQMSAHERSLAAREAKLRTRAAKKSSSLVCPVCSEEFGAPFLHCPHDGAALVADAPRRKSEGHGFCPVCFRGFPGSVKTCPEHGEALRPALPQPKPELDPDLDLDRAPNPPGHAKICPTCGQRFQGGVVFCGEDGTTLVLVN
jgi:hypothetical protein